MTYCLERAPHLPRRAPAEEKFYCTSVHRLAHNNDDDSSYQHTNAAMPQHHCTLIALETDNDSEFDSQWDLRAERSRHFLRHCILLWCARHLYLTTKSVSLSMSIHVALDSLGCRCNSPASMYGSSGCGHRLTRGGSGQRSAAPRLGPIGRTPCL